MAAAAGSGGDVQDRIKESIAQDSGDSIDSFCYFLRVTNIFPVFCGCSCAQNLQAPKRLRSFPKAIKLHANHKDTMGVLVLKHYMF